VSFELCIKTGMVSEQRIVRSYAGPNVLVLTGVQTVASLEILVPKSVKAILSSGLCGGLVPQANVGEGFVCGTLRTPDGDYVADAEWGNRLRHATYFMACTWWSSGKFNTANDLAERTALAERTGAMVIDDETYVVAQFAKARGIPFQVMRTVSDSTYDNLPPAVANALNADGTDNIEAVIASVVSDPLQIPALIRTAFEAKKSYDTLETACACVAPTYEWK
jgi:adenosylhomocysteine nucleosidase